jgi:dihydrofolate reductase
MNRSEPQVVIISAMSHDRIIGIGDGMPWSVPEEYQHFLNTTRDQTIVIGRRSFEIFGSTFTCANCYVVTRSDAKFSAAFTANNLADAVQRAKSHAATIFVAGGASIYGAAIDDVDAMQLSYIHGEFSGDTYFPEFDEDDWIVAKREDRGRYEFVEYRRP